MKSSIGLSIDVIESQSEIGSIIIKALFDDVTKYFDSRLNTLSNSIPEIVIKNIVAQPEYDSLLNGILQYEFGIPDPASRVNEILNTIRNSLTISKKTINARSDSLSGGFKIQMIRKGFEDIISLGASTVFTEKGDNLNWLQWLLLEGDNIIISDYMFVFGPNSKSRTGFGIMRSTLGMSWRVPPEYAGTINNNWITRGIDASIPEIEKEIQQTFND